MGHLHKLFGILLPRRFVPSPLFIYVVNHLFISIWTRGCIFKEIFLLCVIIQFSPSFLSLRLFGLWPSVTFCWPLSLQHTACVCGSLSLVAGATKGSRLVLCRSSPSPTVSRRCEELPLLLLENRLRNQGLAESHSSVWVYTSFIHLLFTDV